jgi:hypothetical protein
MAILRGRWLLVATVSGMLAVGVALPAAAAPGDTTATFTVAVGSLSISVPPTVSFGTWTDVVGGGTLSHALGVVQVTDARSPAAGSGWVATAISTAFTGGTAIAASAIGYTAGPITKVGTATYTANDPPDLTAVHPVVTATGITGDNSATWNPTINVAIPGGAVSGGYSATITQSVA